MAAEAGESPMLSGMSSRVTTRGEAMGVYGLQRVWSFACLLLYLGVVTSCTTLGGTGSGPSLATKTSGQGGGRNPLQ